MAGKHRKIGAKARRVAILTAATATASAMTVGIAAPPATVHSEVVQRPVDLAAAIRLLPNHDQVPDLTGGLGSQIYGGGQALIDQISRAVINGVNLSGLAQAAGLDPKSLLQTLLGDLPANLLPGILASLSLDIPILGPVLDSLTGGDLALLTNILDLLGIDEVTDGTLTGLLALLGLNLSDPLNLAGLAVPGLNVITTGDAFTALKMLGLDLGWLPATPNGVANEINNTPYLKLGVDGVLDIVLDKLENSGLPLVGPLITALAELIGRITDPLTSQLPDVIDLRVIPTIGIGMGAFAAATAYQQVLDQLKSQPGGSAYAGLDPLLGSLTILPLVLLNNPARPDGGAFARFGALASLFGINTVNPTTEVTSDGTGIPVLGTGIKLGAANVLPIMIDATYEYQPLSDLASWPNAFSLVNNLAAGLSPTYMLRGLSLDNLGDQILGQVTDLVQQSVTSGKPLSLNVYLTLHSATMPMLEPLYLASDFLNLVGLAPLAAIPMKLANALAPVVSTLVNLGYANTTRNPDGTYTRDFTNAGVETPFLSFPDVDITKVPGDIINQLIGGFTKEFFSGNPTPNTPNVLSNLLNALLGGGLGGILPNSNPAPGGTPAQNPLGPLGDLLGGLGGLLGGVLGGLGIGAAAAPLATANKTASDIPAADATFSRLSVSGGATDETTTAAATSEKTAAADETVKDPTATTDPTVQDPTVVEKPATTETETTATEPATKPAAEDPVTKPVEKPASTESGSTTDDSATGPKHAKPDTDPAPAAKDTTPKHAKADDDTKSGADTSSSADNTTKDKPSLNVVRNSPNASPDAKPGASETKKDEGAKKDETASAASAGASSEGGSSSNAA
ncbi:hypothetical protein CIW52_34155 [Mycolicibacterium sp. P9-64]|uniref:hypothetical protein n=1 Tax=Mycolicibacterium sp. P9-64 TaxID=2024612 RepID=UPI0011EE07D2|nr:hypothetical protein [Mycolicibacterium sp. P9-64]KAA0074813.1 hypothetical protein CIW52_34155 [Mycolicibacterium sp. P9-64]